MYDLTRFSLRDMTECGMALRRVATVARSMEDAAQAMVQYLYRNLTESQSREPECVLIRFFKTHRFGTLPAELQQFALAHLGTCEASPELRCLTLLATAGLQPEWNDRRQSVGHQAIPLPSVEVVSQSPMIAHLLGQLGVDLGAVVHPDARFLLDLGQRTYNVFHVPEALGSSYLPAQEEFVKPYGVRSVVGFGGVVPTGDLFACILFARVAVPRETAEMFRTVALSVKLGILPFGEEQTFAGGTAGLE